MTSATSMVTVGRAADLCGCDEATIKRDRARGRYPGAHRRPGDRTRTWLIPVQDLIDAGRYVPAPVARKAAADDSDLADARAALERERQAHLATRSELTAARAALDAERRHVDGLLAVLSGAVVRTPDVDRQVPASVLGGAA